MIAELMNLQFHSCECDFKNVALQVCIISKSLYIKNNSRLISVNNEIRRITTLWTEFVTPGLVTVFSIMWNT